MKRGQQNDADQYRHSVTTRRYTKVVNGLPRQYTQPSWPRCAHNEWNEQRRSQIAQHSSSYSNQCRRCICMGLRATQRHFGIVHRKSHWILDAQFKQSYSFYVQNFTLTQSATQWRNKIVNLAFMTFRRKTLKCVDFEALCCCFFDEHSIAAAIMQQCIGTTSKHWNENRIATTNSIAWTVFEPNNFGLSPPWTNLIPIESISQQIIKFVTVLDIFGSHSI